MPKSKVSTKGRPSIPSIGEFYAEYDDDSGMFCVFHTDVDSHAFASYAGKRDATSCADAMNKVAKAKKKPSKR